MKKRFLSALLTLCMVLMLVPITANAMDIYVDLSVTGAATLTLEMENGDSIDTLKQKIQDAAGILPAEQILYYNETLLEDGRTLADYNIQRDSTITLTLQSRVPQAPDTGWVQDNGNWYLLNEDGVMVTGWHSDIPGWEGNWFYLDPATGVLQSSWLQDGGWYYYGEAGAIPADFTIESGYENGLTIGDEQLLTIPEGVTITVNGSLTNCGTLIIKGTVVLSGSGVLNNSGIVAIQESGSLSSSGSVSNAGQTYVDGTFTGTADNLCYPLTLVGAAAAENTSVYNGKTYGKAGSEITLTPNPPAGYAFDKWAVSPSSVTVDADNSFTMPRTPLAITAQWKDTDKPVITGLENGKTYCGAVAFEASDNDGIASVTVNGTGITPDANGQFTLNPASGVQRIVVTNNAGNTTELDVTVNSEHDYEWKDESGQYWKQCKFCGYETAKKDIPTITIDGANAVCVTQDYTFSFTLPEGATDPAYYFVLEGSISIDSNVFQPAIIRNNKPYGVVPATEFRNSNGSFVVTARVKTADGYEISATKTVALGHIYTSSKDTLCAVCGEKRLCDICGATYSENIVGNHKSHHDMLVNSSCKAKEDSVHIDENPKDHFCDACGGGLSEHWGGLVTCTEAAVCDYCKQEYGPMGHNYISTVIDGFTQYKCENCGDAYWISFTKSDSDELTVLPNGETLYHYCTHEGLTPDDLPEGQNKVFLQDPLRIANRMEADGLNIYEMLDGAQQIIPSSTAKKLSFRSDAVFEDFDQVSLDGLVLPKKYYSVTRGSTIVTLNADFVATLAPGIHLFGILSTDGIALTTFTVAEAASPQTGDNSPMALWIALFVVSGGLLTVMAVYGIRKKRSAR